MHTILNSATVIAVTPAHRLAPEIAIAACRAGALGILDLGLGAGPAARRLALSALARGAAGHGEWGVRWNHVGQDAADLVELARLSDDPATPLPLLVLAGIRDDQLDAARRLAAGLARAVLLEVCDLDGALAADRAGYDGVILKGHEAGGRVGALSSFVLLQECAGKLDLPYWIQGGIGIHSAAAAALSGATGVVLCEQLWLAAEGPFDAAEARAWSHLDGSETVLAGAGAERHRLSGRAGRARLRLVELAQAHGESCLPLLNAHLAAADDGLIALGQEIGFAAALAQRYGTVGRIVTAVKDGMADATRLAEARRALAPGAPLAAALGTRYPVAQGPMTRVSDVAPFARAVAGGGALPFLALAVMRGPQVRAMLEATRDAVGDLPWGVGLLGFMPLALRQEQLDVVREFRPPYAVIAGGRPGQARELEALGIATWLHVPSPGLLKGFLAEGARRFVFEGSECGGHTGPRSSFTLWEQAIAVLLDSELKDPESVQLMFAGGIHDALSAAMVGVLAAPLTARGMRIGVWMGSAYLFTSEIVASGAVVAEFQRQALACRDTALLQSGVGVYTRCAETPFCAEFEHLRRELVRGPGSREETLLALEKMNIGRLRIAAKGIARNPDPDAGERYLHVDAEAQRRDGVYMLGDVARLRDRGCTIAELHQAVSDDAVALLTEAEARARTKSPAPTPAGAGRDAIAIVGMAGLWPGARTLREYWENIVRGVDSVREVDPERWNAERLFNPKRGAPDQVYAKWGGFLDDIAFDPQRYGIAPASLASIEPMQLLALETARLALADAGFDRRPFPRERTATIFAVGGMADLSTHYNFRTLLPLYLDRVEGLAPELRGHIVATLNRDALPVWTEDTFPGILGNVVTGRIANRLDLGGSNYTVDAACAASLAALDAAVKQLRNGDADVVLAGGIDCTNGAIGFMCFAQTHALSPSGRSRPFDHRADGIAISEGAGVLVLKRLADAERDGDRVYALIKGIGSSSDGRNRSLTAPHPAGQVLALRRAYRDAGLSPSAVTLIEAHGTGTALGDKSELAALAAFAGDTMARQGCALGSVKSMIGHTKVAAGMAGLIKAALALQQRVLPPTIGVERPTNAVDLADSPFYLNTEARPWLHAGGAARHCGVSAFGFGGTNFHAVLGEYTAGYRAAEVPSLQPRGVELFAFAAADRERIVAAVRALLDGLAPARDADLAALAYAVYREQHVARRANGGQPCRLIVLAGSVDELRARLRRVLELLPDHAEIRQPPAIYYRESTADVGAVCFMFPGQGSQRVNMLRDLLLGRPALQAGFETAPSIAGLVYPPPVFSDAERELQQHALNATDVAQPALGLVGMAAFDLLSAYGLKPDFAAGHSYGEYVALCAAGAISRADLLRLSLARGRLAAAAPAGAMAVLDGDAAQVAALLRRHRLEATIANLNSPSQTIIAGAAEAIDAALSAAAGEGVRIRKLAVSAAFHCPLMAGVCDALAVELAEVELLPPRMPVYSNTSAAPHAADGGAVRALLARHIAEPVRFVEQVEAMYQAGARVFIECGPGLVLNGLVEQILGQRPHTRLALDAPGRPGWQQLAQLLTQAMAIGLPVDLAPWFAGRGLEEGDVAQVLAGAKRRAEPPALAWRVNGGRAQPWYAAPAAAAARAAITAAAITPPAAPAVVVPPATPPATPPVAPAVVVRRTEPAAVAPPAVPPAASATIMRRTDPAAVAPPAVPPAAPATIMRRTEPAAVSPPAVAPAAPAAITRRTEPAAGPPYAPAANTPRAMPVVTLAATSSAPPAAGSAVMVAPVRSPRNVAASRRQPLYPPHYRRSIMNLDDYTPDDRFAATSGSPEPVSQIQDSLSRLLDLQREQQFSLRHFLDFQAQLAGLGVERRPDAPPLAAPRPAAQATLARVAPTAEVPVPAATIPSAAMPAVPAAEVSAPAATGYSAAASAAVAPPLAAVAPADRATPPIAPAPAVMELGAVQAPHLPPELRAAPPAADPPVPDAESFKAELLKAVSERTGYPTDMLDMDAHMEADLGIDSIKRIEIFSGLTTRYNLIGERDEETVIAELSGYKSLNEIVAWYARSLDPEATADTALGDVTPKKAQAPLPPSSEAMEPVNTDPVRCYALQAIRAELAPEAAGAALQPAAPVLLLGVDTPLSEALTELLTAEGHPVRRLLPAAATRRLDAQRHEVDVSSPEGIAAWRDKADIDASGGLILINLMGCDDAAPAAHLGDARALFLLLKALAPELRAAAAAGGGWLLNATRLDGQFGLSRSRPLAVGSAGTLGVTKTAAREWPALRARCVDAAPGLAPQWLARQLLRELRGADGEIEIGYTDAGRWRLGLRDQPPASADAIAALTPALEPGAVLLVTGGAYGITADVACTLAAAYRPTLVLLGRSPLPGPEEDHTRGIGDAAALRQMLIGRMRIGDPAITPAQVDGALKRILKERRIRANLAAMRAGGAEVEYHCLDARDGVALGRLIDDVHARHGRIDGVLHGAGVIGDKLIVDKTPQGFDAVFDTKVAPALVLADKLRPESLKFIAFFSSVAGRYGNPGQCDYSAANEVLNKLADDLSHRWPGVHALAINWGPWDAGMVDPGLRRLYAARAIQPIAVEEGRRQFMRALSGGDRGAPELVISASVRQIAAPAHFNHAPSGGTP